MNWYKQAMLARDMLPPGTTDIRETEENGHAARGKYPCPNCKTISTISACSDVGGIWLRCPKCGLIDN